MSLRRTLRFGPILVVALGSTFCGPHRVATAPAPAPVQVPTRDIEALIERGCFRCLNDALQLARDRKASDLAFEAAALLTLRAKELGIDPEQWRAQAQELAAADPTRTSYVEMVAAVPPDPLSGRREDLLFETQARNKARSLLPMWRESLRTGSGSVALRRYIELAIDCQVDVSRERADEVSKVAADLPELPLLTYRLSLCNTLDPNANVARLTAVQQRDPEFVDVDFPLGRYALERRDGQDQDEAMRRFQSAATAFPSSVVIAMSIGNLYQSWDEWKNALDAYDRVLAMLPTHPDALLGRTISQSQLLRHPEAIETATRLINGGQWFLGQAFYWRSWNHFNMGNNDLARADADRTRTLMVNSSVFLLSGLIEWRAPRLPSAEKEFEQSIAMDFGQCPAALYLGGVRAEESKVPEAIAALSQARQCYDLSITVHRAAIEKINSGPGTQASKARGVAREERVIADAEARRGQAVRALETLEKRATSGAR